MKRIIFGFIAVLTVFAMISCDNGSTPKKETFTVTFNSNGGSNVAPITGVKKDAKISKPADPTQSGYTFIGWVKPTGAPWDFAVDTVTANITLKAVWVQGEIDLEDLFLMPAYTTSSDDANQKVWPTNGVSGAVSTLTYDILKSAKYLVIETKGLSGKNDDGSPNYTGIGGFKVSLNGDGNGWDYKETNITNDWLEFFYTANDTVIFVIELSKLTGYSAIITDTATQVKLGIGYWPFNMLGFQSAYLLLNDVTYDKPAFGVVNLASNAGFAYIKDYPPINWGTPGPATGSIVEEISLANAWFAVYEFTLPTGKTWADYRGTITADYKITQATITGGTPRAVRVMGNFLPVEVANPTLGKYTTGSGDTAVTSNIATVGNWPGGSSNDWIISQIGSSWDAGKIPDVLADWIVPKGTDIAADTWFTVQYPLMQGKQNGTWNSTGVRKPGAGDTGPFYFAVGIPGAGTANTFQVTNVTLKGKAVADDVVGAPLYYTKDNVDYRALSGQLSSPDANGICTNVNGGNPGWRIVSGTPAKKAITAIETVTIKFNSGGGSTVADMVINKGSVLTDAQLKPGTTRPGYRLDGWFTAETGGTAVPGMKIFTDAETTYYARWTELPDATADFDVSGAAGFKVQSFGGLGSLNDNAGLGPFNYDSTAANANAIWFAYPTVVSTANYATIDIVIKITPKSGATDTSYLTGATAADTAKLAVQNGRAANSWSGGTSVYKDIKDDDLGTGANVGEYLISIPVTSVGITLQQNGGASFNLTLVSITLKKPVAAP